MTVTSNMSLNKKAPAHVRRKALSQPQQASCTSPSSSRKPIQQPRSLRNDSVSLLKQQNSSNRIRYPPFISTSYKPLPYHQTHRHLSFTSQEKLALYNRTTSFTTTSLRLLHPAIRQSKPRRSQIFRLGQFASLCPVGCKERTSVTRAHHNHKPESQHDQIWQPQPDRRRRQLLEPQHKSLRHSIVREAHNDSRQGEAPERLWPSKGIRTRVNVAFTQH